MRKQTKLVAVLSAAALLAIGASMTSFAAAGWVQEGEDWVYLNKDGDREADVWRRHGDNYYWLDENGVLARNALIKDETVGATYCVDENGVRVTNAWREVPNDDGAQVGSEETDDTPAVVYYYFGSSGKAYTGTDKKVREIDGKYYMFNEEGQMLYGWHRATNKTTEDLYYFGTEKEGFAYTGWQQLAPGDYLNREDYDDKEWFYFSSTGKAVVNRSYYYEGKYYRFDENGIMVDDWYTNENSAPSAASGARAYSTYYGAKTGWVYTGDADLSEEARYDNDARYWYYLVNVTGEGAVARSIPYNYQKDTNFARAMVIKNKTYLFGEKGKMLRGFVVVDSPANRTLSVKAGGATYTTLVNGTTVDADGTTVAWNRIERTKETPGCQEVNDILGADKPFGYTYNAHGDILTDSSGQPIGQPVTGGRTLANGLYYFKEDGGALEGQMQMGRTAIVNDGETFYYYFSKENLFPGYAYTNAIQDGYLYGQDGKCIVADSGNSYAVYRLPARVRIMNGTKAGAPIDADKRVIVSRTGKVKTSGTVTIDGVKYTINSTDYTVENETPVD